MKFSFLPLIGALSLLLLGSCTTFRLDPLARDGVTVRQDRNQSAALVEGDALALEARALWGPEVKFVLKVKNKSGKTLRLDSSRFRVYAGEPDRWTETRVIPGDEVYEKSQRFLVAGTVLLAVGAVAFSRPDTVTTRDTTSVTAVDTGGGSSVVLVQTQRRTYVEEGNTGQNLAAVGRFAQDGSKGLEDLKNNLFYAVDLEAGRSYDGWVFGETGKGNYYKLVVPVEGQELSVVFEKVKTRW